MFEFVEKYIDLVIKLLMVAVAVASLASMFMIFGFAPTEAVMGLPQKIFYYHVPIAILSYAGFFICFVGSAVYLYTGRHEHDAYAVSGAEVGTLFITLVMITGMLWGKPSWGAYWTWDPRLTTSLVLWLIYTGYLLLRSQVEDSTLRAKYAAVMGIVGFVDVPIVHYSVQLWTRGIHPVVDKSGADHGMDPRMLKTLMLCFPTMALIFALLFAVRFRYEMMSRRLDMLKSQSNESGIAGN
ncbi:MAG: cytochrome c biogenesis protein CcsA [Nitrospinota bacterium]|nr:cytochrome c biogenesis protein CcsA [Nitrospinota bacterium]MDH5677602.1 cytochrome c biogenesis protein CcsA [Nitrospinota bacterium]MDH5756520.1 cytochrome c biogenesis protein CcsA [Nitrospinota bacterium]